MQITRLGSGGDGVAEIPDGQVHVPFALPGEIVVVGAGTGNRRRMISIEVQSEKRTTPFCEYYTRCGGCVFQHLDESAYVVWKHEKVASTLRWAGLEQAPEALLDGHGEGRRRVVLHVRRIDGMVRAGFMEAGTHRLVPIERCPITVPGLGRATKVAEALGELVIKGDKPLDAAITATSAGLDVDLRGSGRPSDRLTQNLILSAQNLDIARLSVHGDVLVERRAPILAMGRSQPILPPGAFLQATAHGEEFLAREVVAAASGAKRVADLFSGIGPFALRLAARAEVHAVEGQAAMLTALDRAARETPGLRRVTTEVRDLFRRPLLPPELDRFDAVVLDPPRQGAEAQVRQLSASSLERVIMVSCDAGTFARDAATLVASGFLLKRVVPVDQFKWSPHVEIVGVFERPATRMARRRRG